MRSKLKVNLPERQDVNFDFTQENQVLPLVITPKVDGISIVEWASENKIILEELLTTYGGILFRDFNVNSSMVFEGFIDSVSDSALEYKERSSPRSVVSGNVYTSTDHPEDKEIFLHSEQSYNLCFPSRIFFYCDKPSETGGNTPIADARKIYERIAPAVREKFIKKKYRYSRYFWPMMGMTWEKAFQSNDKKVVEQYCMENDIHFEWVGDDALKTYQERAVVAKHPFSGEKCWFNHCTFFHITSLDPHTQEILTSSFTDEELPNNTYYGDGEKIEAEIMVQLRDAYEQEKVEFDWQKGDVLMLDNMLMTHGRRKYSGERRILTGMSALWQWSEVEYTH